MHKYGQGTKRLLAAAVSWGSVDDYSIEDGSRRRRRSCRSRKGPLAAAEAQEERYVRPHMYIHITL
jgi:hypothetical protein